MKERKTTEISLFDLDNTLLAGDSDYLWGEFMIENGLVDATMHRAENERYYQDYLAGTLDINAFIAFQLDPLTKHDRQELLEFRERFIDEKIRPIVLSQAMALVERHRQKGHTCLIITATNRFITEPIAELFGVDELLATEPELQNGQYTGRCVGVPCFQSGKVKRLEQWLQQNDLTVEKSHFYSDSHNDLPLLSKVDHPVAVDPDESLANHAREQGWPIISLRDRP